MLYCRLSRIPVTRQPSIMTTANSHFSLDYLLTEYEKTHLNPTNRNIHMVCVPAIVTVTLGLFWGLSALLWGPSVTGISLPWFAIANLATIGAILAGIYYLRLSTLLFAVMLGYGLASLALLYVLHMYIGAWGVLLISAGVWLLAWVAQFIGHNIEGAKPSFLQDLVFLLIGPAFVLEKILRTRGKSLLG